MTGKKWTTLNGTLVFPLSVGSCALIAAGGRFIRTSRVVAIGRVERNEVSFETMNTHYRLLLDPVPQAAACMAA